MELKSRITTEDQLMALQSNTQIYMYDSGLHDIRRFRVLARVPYRTMQIMAFYEGSSMMQLSKHQLNRVILTDHDEAYRYLAYQLRDEADAVERIHLNKTEKGS